MLKYDTFSKIKYPKYLNFFVIIIIMFLTITFCFKKVYETYSDFLVITDNYQSIIKVPLEYTNSIINNHKIYVNNQIYKYKIVEISEVLSENHINYQEFLLEVNLPEKYKINNLVLNYQIKNNKQVLGKFILSRILERSKG